MSTAQTLVASGAYRDLDEPVIVTSGESLTPFYVNAEKLCGDPDMDAFLAAHGDSDVEIVERACALASSNGPFAELVAQTADLVSGLLGAARSPLVSGGQRRDWLFSGPVARRLGLPHVSLYKQGQGQAPERDRVIVRSPTGAELPGTLLAGSRAVHVVDMVTAASSCHARDPISGRDVGWVPMLRARGVEIHDLVAVVSRRQGGEEALERVGVCVRSMFVVDEAFLRGHARAASDAVAYYRDARAWTRAYLREHGTGPLRAYLVEDAKKLPRLMKFLRLYRSSLEPSAWAELDGEARARLGRGLDELLAGEP